MTTSKLFKAHIDELQSMADAGDWFAAKSLACMALLIDGWRYGDPDPTDPPNDSGEPIDLAAYRRKLAA